MMSSCVRSPVSSAVTVPLRNTSTRSQMTARSAASTEEMMMPQPSAAASRIASMMSCLAPTSTAWVGSCSTGRPGFPPQPLGEQSLLLVAAGQGADELVRVRGLDVQLLDHGGRLFGLPAAADLPPGTAGGAPRQ